MIKKKNTPQGNNNDEVLAALKTIAQSQQDINDRMDDIEKKAGDGAARLLIAERLFNTDDEHLAELTVIPLRAVRAYSRAMSASMIMSDKVQKEGVSLSSIRRNAIFQLMRSVKGNWGEKGMRLAEQQAEAESEKGDEYSSGQGLP